MSDSGAIVPYRAADGSVQLYVRVEGETVWLTQAQLADLFDTTVQNVNQHVLNVLAERELLPEATIKDFLIVRREGTREVKRTISHYNLDMIISVGYRVHSKTATLFRIWATQQLRELIVKGFVMDDARLKDPARSAYFDELLQRIRDIRASEKLFYLKVRELFSTAVDYDAQTPLARDFFATVQNKLLYAVTGQRATEIITRRSDPDSITMGLTQFPGRRPTRRDVVIAKNYLTEAEISTLNRLVTMLLDYAEDRARRRSPLTMEAWALQVDRFLEFNDYEVVAGAGSISRDRAERDVLERFDTWADARRHEQDRRDDDRAALESAHELGELGQRLQARVQSGLEPHQRDATPQEDL